MRWMASLMTAVTVGTLAVVGIVDAGRRGLWTPAILFAAIALISIATILRGRRNSVQVRADHRAWLENAAAVTGEPVEVVASRAIGAYRDAC